MTSIFRLISLHQTQEKQRAPHGFDDVQDVMKKQENYAAENACINALTTKETCAPVASETSVQAGPAVEASNLETARGTTAAGKPTQKVAEISAEKVVTSSPLTPSSSPIPQYDGLQDKTMKTPDDSTSSHSTNHKPAIQPADLNCSSSYSLFFCTLCSEAFKSRDMLEQHKNEHDEPVPEFFPLVCDTCHQTFEPDEYMDHLDSDCK